MFFKKIILMCVIMITNNVYANTCTSESSFNHQVFYVNGINTEENKAKEELKVVENLLTQSNITIKNEPILFHNTSTHKIIDIMEVFEMKFEAHNVNYNPTEDNAYDRYINPNKYFSNFLKYLPPEAIDDLENTLNQKLYIQDDITDQEMIEFALNIVNSLSKDKIITFISYSQGNLFAERIVEYIQTYYPEYKNSFSWMGIASPAKNHFTQSKNEYYHPLNEEKLLTAYHTAHDDKVINALRLTGFKIAPSNIENKNSFDLRVDSNHHKLEDSYLREGLPSYTAISNDLVKFSQNMRPSSSFIGTKDNVYFALKNTPNAIELPEIILRNTSGDEFPMNYDEEDNSFSYNLTCSELLTDTYDILIRYNENSTDAFYSFFFDYMFMNDGSYKNDSYNSLGVFINPLKQNTLRDRTINIGSFNFDDTYDGIIPDLKFNGVINNKDNDFFFLEFGLNDIIYIDYDDLSTKTNKNLILLIPNEKDGWTYNFPESISPMESNNYSNYRIKFRKSDKTYKYLYLKANVGGQIAVLNKFLIQYRKFSEVISNF